MTKMTPLLTRNEQFAAAYTPGSLGPPAAQVVILTCLDHRVDPAITLGLRLGDAVVIRNAGGRVTEAVIDDITYLAFLAGQLFGGQVAAEGLFEVAVVHHTQCGTGFLADPGFRHRAAEATGLAEAALEAAAVADPRATVKADVERLLAAPSLSPQVSVSGHVYDIATGRVTTVLDARHPQLAGNNQLTLGVRPGPGGLPAGARPTGEPLVAADVYGSRRLVVAPFSHDGGAPGAFATARSAAAALARDKKDEPAAIDEKAPFRRQE